jgi:C1A family cysteine protease
MKGCKVIVCFMAFVVIFLGGKQAAAYSELVTGVEAGQAEKAADSEIGQLKEVTEATGVKSEKAEDTDGKDESLEVFARVQKGSDRAVWVNVQGETVEVQERKQQAVRAFSGKKAALPDSFDWREEGNGLSAVKDQGAYGTCWAMAGMAAAEASVVRTGLSYRESWLWNGKLSFSAAQLAWYLFENPAEGDGRYGDYIERSFKGAEGGDYFCVIAGLAASGVQIEKNAPYENWNYGQSGEARDVSYYQLKNADYLDYASTKEAQATVKQWICSRGAVECGLYFETMEKEECYYQTSYSEEYGNHEVVLVGWDDHYAKENFKENGAMPEYDGAWIAQNSYGEEWGEGGYFYISYEEPSLYGFVSYELEEKEDGETCRQYDGIGGFIGVSSAAVQKAANVFTAEETEELKSVGVSVSELNSSGVDYEIQIYKWKEKTALATTKEMINTGDLLKQTSASDYFTEDYLVKEAETEGVFEYSGYHKIALACPISLEEGESYAVVLTLSPRDGHSEVYYSFEGSVNGYDMDEFHYGAEKGQTFYLKGFGEEGEWKDVKSLNKKTDGFELGNLNLKAFTYAKERTEDSEYQEQKAQLKETAALAEEFLEQAEALGKKQELSGEEQKKFAFLKGNTSYNEELLSFLKEECLFAEETLREEDAAIYELSNAYLSLENAMSYFAYPAKRSIQTAEELYALSEETASLNVNALAVVSIEADLKMNPMSIFRFDRFDTEQSKQDKGIIVNGDSANARNFPPIGGSGGVEFTIEGNGHTISGLVSTPTITADDSIPGAYGGLVGCLIGDGTIQNLTIKNSYIKGNRYVGAFAGALLYGGRIENCSVKNTYVRGYESIDTTTYQTIMPQYIGGFAGLVSYYNKERRSGVFSSKAEQCFVYGGFSTGGMIGMVSSGASGGSGNTVENSSVVGLASYSKYRNGVGIYFGAETDAENEEKEHYIFTNSSSKKKDVLLIDLYKPKGAENDEDLLLFVEPYHGKYTLKSVFLQGNAKKKKRGKDFMQDGYRIRKMAGDLSIAPMTKRQYTVTFYSLLTGEKTASQTVLRGHKAKLVKAEKIKGYKFLGWYDAQNKRFRFKKKVKQDYALYAKYKKRTKK